PTRADVGLPLRPGHVAVRFLDRDEQRVVVEPGRLLAAEGLEALHDLGLLRRAAVRGLQPRQLEVDHGAVVDVACGEVSAPHVPRAQQSLLDQEVEAHQQRVAGEGGEALVGRVAVAGGPQRQHLPELLLRGGQEVEEAEGLRSQLAEAEAAGQRRGMQKDPAHALREGGTGGSVEGGVAVRRGGGARQGVLGGGGGGSSTARHSDTKATRLCEPSQNGLLADCPQRHSLISVRPASLKVVPSWSARTWLSRSTWGGAVLRTVMRVSAILRRLLADTIRRGRP